MAFRTEGDLAFRTEGDLVFRTEGDLVFRTEGDLAFRTEGDLALDFCADKDRYDGDDFPKGIWGTSCSITLLAK